MNLAKIEDYFNASELLDNTPLHIIGCGAVGSHIAEQLVRIGCENIHLWDFDTVSAHNITNQMFIQDDIGNMKTNSVAKYIDAINPSVEKTLVQHIQGWQGEILNGYVFLCVDNIDLRREIVLKNRFNTNCIAIFDFRMRLTDAQHYAAIIKEPKTVKDLLNTMDFTHEEAKDATPKSACNTELSVIPTVKMITALGVNNFMRMAMGLSTKKLILVDLAQLTLDAF